MSLLEPHALTPPHVPSAFERAGVALLWLWLAFARGLAFVGWLLLALAALSALHALIGALRAPAPPIRPRSRPA